MISCILLGNLNKFCVFVISLFPQCQISVLSCILFKKDSGGADVAVGAVVGKGTRNTASVAIANGEQVELPKVGLFQTHRGSQNILYCFGIANVIHNVCHVGGHYRE